MTSGNFRSSTEEVFDFLNITMGIFKIIKPLKGISLTFHPQLEPILQIRKPKDL